MDRVPLGISSYKGKKINMFCLYYCLQLMRIRFQNAKSIVLRLIVFYLHMTICKIDGLLFIYHIETMMFFKLIICHFDKVSCNSVEQNKLTIGMR